MSNTESKTDDRQARREQRDALQQFVDHQIATEVSEDPRAIVQNAARATREWIWAKPQQGMHRVLDEILASAFVGQRYRLLRHAGRPDRDVVAELEISGGGQLPLPQMNELIRWRWASRNGKAEKSVWQSMLSELDALDADYEARQIDMAAKRRYLQVIRAKWRECGVVDPTETVEQFYLRIGKAA